MSYRSIFRRAVRIIRSRLSGAVESPVEEKRTSAEGSDETRRSAGTGESGTESRADSGRSDRARDRKGELSDTECYRILGLSSAADRNELRERYRELMAQYHPDKVASLGTELQELAARKTKEINEAYQTLRNRGKA